MALENAQSPREMFEDAVEDNLRAIIADDAKHLLPTVTQNIMEALEHYEERKAVLDRA